MLNQFMDEVVSGGADAVLPQNLDQKWLDMIYTASRRFIRATALVVEKGSEKKYDFSDLYSNLLLSAVMEILHRERGKLVETDELKVPEEAVYEAILCYAMSIVYECISREADFSLPQPTIETILDRERLFDVETAHPELTALLQQVIMEGDDLPNDQ